MPKFVRRNKLIIDLPKVSKGTYSIIIPVFNSQNSLEELCLRIHDFFKVNGHPFEVIFIEDCSRDKSWEVLTRLKEKFPTTVTAIRLAKNYGQHNATMCGLTLAKGDFIITLDDDLQTPPEEIALLIKKMNETQVEIVYGIYMNRQQDSVRNIGNNLAQKMFHYVFQSKGKISSFRIMTAELCKRISKHKQSFIFVDVLIHWSTQYIERVPVEHAKRKYGKSNYSLMSLIRLANNLLVTFTTLPLRLIAYFGALLSGLSILSGGFFLARKIIYSAPAGNMGIIITLMFSTGLILFVIGFIGEYISRIHMLQNEKPQYAIKESI